MVDNFEEGDYNFLYQSVHTLKEKHRASLYKEYIGFVFLSYHLLDDLTGQENLEMSLPIKNIKVQNARQLWLIC